MMVRVLIGVGVLAVALVVWNVIAARTDSTARTPVNLEYETPQELIALATPVTEGPDGAAVTVMDFSDYSCPACRTFATRVKPVLDAAYVDRELVQFAYYDFILGSFPNSFVAARAARCANDQAGYWAYHDRLFQQQDSWARMADPVATLERYAEDLGLDGAEFRSCLRSDRHADVVTANSLLGQQLGVSQTPTIMVNTGVGRATRVDDWGNIEAYRGVIDEALARAGVAPSAEGAAEGEPEPDEGEPEAGS